jgi:hypothetical protein
MGRYYNGDINGKFWFGVQPSNSADRFGVTGHVPEYIEYQFNEEDKPGVETELKRIENELSDQLQLIEGFFTKHDSYSNAMLIEHGINEDDLREYADYKLGQQILDCLNERGYCEFTAEL